MIIVDTSVWIDYFCDTETQQTAWLETELGHQRLAIIDLILCEVLQGIREDKKFKEILRSISQFEIFSSGGTSLAVDAAKNYRALRSQGITVRKTIDCLIATFCIRNGHTLLHCDRDFDAFEAKLGLQVVHPE